MKKFLGLFSFYLIFSGVIAAQDKPVLDTNPPPVAPKRSVSKTVGSAEVLYNEAKDESVVRNKAITLFRTEAGWGTISSSFQFKGKTIQRPTDVTISIFIAAKDRTYIDDRKLVLHADGKKVFDGISELSDGRTNGREIYSSLRISLPLKDFNKVAEAEKLALQVGPTTFGLTSVDLSGFRDLLKIVDDAL